MTSLYRRLTWSLFLLISPLAVQGEPTTYSVGVEITDYPPFYYLDNGEYAGEARQLLDQFAAASSAHFDYEALPVPRLFLLFTRNQFDFKFPDNPQWSPGLKSGLTIYYSDPVMQVSEAVMTLADNHEPVRIVGTILGFTTPGISFQLTEGSLILVEASTMEQLFMMLAAGRIDAIYFNTKVAEYESQHRPTPLQLVVRPEYPPYRYAYHLSSIRHPELIDAFNQFLHRYQASKSNTALK